MTEYVIDVRTPRLGLRAYHVGAESLLEAEQEATAMAEVDDPGGIPIVENAIRYQERHR